MNCQEALDLLYDIIDQEVSEIDEAQVRSHLEKCRHCSEIFRLESSIQNFLDAKTANVGSSDNLESLRSKIVSDLDGIDRTEMDCSSKSKLGGTTLFMVSAAALIILVGASFFTSDLVRHYNVYGPLEQAHFAAQLHQPSNSVMEQTLAAVKSSFGFSPGTVVNSFSLIDARMEKILGVDMAHFVYADNGKRVSVFVALSDEFDVPSGLKDHKVVRGNLEYYDHHCRGCRLVYHQSGSAIIITATEDKETELLSFIPGSTII
ncbi:MAG: zf-HC2 domain-containing protein [bacterium]|nr:zf-HC2 domain-containing protein [bacterium]